jgi:ectoine hydroxylase-related dioxygenase (phytanoyl-CoA dioxygenase family)
LNAHTTSPAIDVDAAVAAVEADGFAVVPGVLTAAEVATALERLWDARDENERLGLPTFQAVIDPNASNVRVMNLPGCDQVFRDLLEHPVADAIAARLLGGDYIVSNFTANIARPGSGSMGIHSDQALIAPEPWMDRWAINIIWCFGDIRPENGATLYVPGSHLSATRADLPADLEGALVPFTASAGSIAVMDGRAWHTSGANVTEAEDRPLAFAYYTKPFLRPQMNWTASLRRDVRQTFSPKMRHRLGLDWMLNGTVPPELDRTTPARNLEDDNPQGNE